MQHNLQAITMFYFMQMHDVSTCYYHIVSLLTLFYKSISLLHNFRQEKKQTKLSEPESMTPFGVTGNERVELNPELETRNPGLETRIIGLETRYSMISNPRLSG